MLKLWRGKMRIIVLILLLFVSFEVNSATNQQRIRDMLPSYIKYSNKVPYIDCGINGIHMFYSWKGLRKIIWEWRTDTFRTKREVCRILWKKGL